MDTTWKGMMFMSEAKSFDITKREVWDAYKRVKANRGAAGVDGVGIIEFDHDLSKNLYRIWNRMASGSYFPSPVKRVDIPKGDGKTRPLGIPTVADRIAQMVVRRRQSRCWSRYSIKILMDTDQGARHIMPCVLPEIVAGSVLGCLTLTSRVLR
jgi:hypothetical protein